MSENFFMITNETKLNISIIIKYKKGAFYKLYHLGEPHIGVMGFSCIYSGIRDKE